MAMCRYMRSTVRLGLMRPSASVATLLGRSSKVYRCLGLLGRLSVEIWDTVWIGGCSLGLVIVPPVVVGVSVLSTGCLRYIWHDLHATGNHASRSSAACSIRRSRWSTESLSQLLYKSLPDIIGSDMNSICNTKHYERPFCRQR